MHEHDGTDEVVCPYCGHKHDNSTEWFDTKSDVTIECENEECEREFFASREVSVTYSTFPKS